MSEPAWNGKDKREKLIELMFEKFNVPGKFHVKFVKLLTCFSLLPGQIARVDGLCQWPRQWFDC